MRILLDECVPWPMRKLLARPLLHDGAETRLARRQERRPHPPGRNRIRHLHHLRQNIRYQQNLAARRIAILELTSNDLRRILAAGSDICAAVAAIQPGEYVHLPIP